MQARTRPGISRSESGASTRNGSSTRQSVASVTCAYARERVEPDVVGAREALQNAARPLAQRGEFVKVPVEARYGLARELQQLNDPGVARRIGRVAPTRHLRKTMVQRLYQQAAALGRIEQIVLQIRVAVDDPDIAKHLIEHARRSAGAPHAAQFVEHLPSRQPQQPDDDFPIRMRGVIVGDLPQSSRRLLLRCGASGPDRLESGVHATMILTQADFEFADNRGT